MFQILCENDNHIIANGYHNYFDEQDDTVELLCVSDVEKLIKLSWTDLILNKFNYCPFCGKELRGVSNA